MSLLAATAITIGLHLQSRHFPAHDYQRNRNEGIYLRAESWQVGTYRNTLDREAVYASYIKPVGPVDLMLGASTGYQIRTRDGQTSGFSHNYLAPMAGASYLVPVKLMGVSPRIFFSPGMCGASSVLHLSIEASL